MIKIKQYREKYKKLWDYFVENSKNGTFMLKRNYMEYHNNRFEDFSLLFYKNTKLIALLPASIHGDELRSHGGLTYGGIIVKADMTIQDMLDIFHEIKKFLKAKCIKTFLYKRPPAIYHLIPSDEDTIALVQNNAILIKREASTAILLKDKIKFSNLRTRGVKKALKNELFVKESSDYEKYFDLLNEILIKYHNTKPAHSAAELKLLAGRFPDNIKLFCAFDNKYKMYCGVIIFITKQTIHAQYIANSDEGRKIGALDLVMDYLINEYSKGKKYFDFGISCENQGLFLNEGLISQKEGFGGRSIVYDCWRMDI